VVPLKKMMLLKALMKRSNLNMNVNPKKEKVSKNVDERNERINQIQDKRSSDFSVRGNKGGRNDGGGRSIASGELKKLAQ